VATVPFRWDVGPPVHQPLLRCFGLLHSLGITFTHVWPLGALESAILPLKVLKLKAFCFVFFLFKDFIYLTERGEPRAGGGAEGEADSLLSWEPDTGLDPRTQGS